MYVYLPIYIAIRLAISISELTSLPDTYTITVWSNLYRVDHTHRYIRKKKSHNGSIYGIQETAVTYNPIDMESISYSDTNSSASVSDQEALELDIPVDQELTTIDPMEQEALNTNPVDQKPTNIEASLVTGFKNTPVTY